MASELAQQLSRLRTENAYVGAVAGESRRFPSLFLGPKEAAGVDTEAVYDAAVSGLNELRQYDDRFNVYLDSILHPSTVSLQRELKTLEVPHPFSSHIYHSSYIMTIISISFAGKQSIRQATRGITSASIYIYE